MESIRSVLGGNTGKCRGDFSKAARLLIRSQFDSGSEKFFIGGVEYRRSSIDKDGRMLNAALVGGTMETVNELLSVEIEKVNEVKEALQSAANQIRALGDVLYPEIAEQVGKLRAARMTIASEMESSLKSMREVRKFFLESDYQVEIERLQRFVKLCHEIESLRKTGVFDAVCNSAIRLAIRESEQ